MKCVLAQIYKVNFYLLQNIIAGSIYKYIKTNILRERFKENN